MTNKENNKSSTCAMMKVQVTLLSPLAHFHLLIAFYYYNIQVGIVFIAFSQHNQNNKMFTKKKNTSRFRNIFLYNKFAM